MNPEELNRKLVEMEPYPKTGIVQMICIRPSEGKRKLITKGILSVENGLEGDNWKERGSRHTEDGTSHPEMQITLMSSKIISIVTSEKSVWQEAGDQFFVDFDLGVENLPVGSRIKMGQAILEITKIPHTSCRKFLKRFGREATDFITQKEYSNLRLRGVNTKIIQGGIVQLGDSIRKLE